MPKKYDFGGYATRVDVKCTDGRVIRSGAFKDDDKKRVPLVWQHFSNDPELVLGHADLEYRNDGAYAYCKFNNNPKAQIAKELVNSGDITALSIHANRLQQVGNSVIHGEIKEVSLVTAGANSGAYIDNLEIEHSDGDTERLIDQAIIYTGEDFEPYVEHEDKENQNDSKKEEKDTKEAVKSIKDAIDSMNEEQKTAMYTVVGLALAEADGDEEDDEMDHSDEGGTIMKYNPFSEKDKKTDTELTHADTEAIFADAKHRGSLKQAVLSHGIENLEILFPEAKATSTIPELVQRDQEWVGKLWNATSKTPFSRIKTVNADITKDEARARGYIKGKKKLEEQFSVFKRVTTPQTVYKLQKMDRDDIIDITDFDVVVWIKAEMRLMLNEELARAVLIGDGREVGAEDKISEEHIRPVMNDNEMYTHHVTVTISDVNDNSEFADAIVEGAVMSRIDYKGSGNPTAWVNSKTMAKMLLSKDKIGRRIYANANEVAISLRCKEMVEVPVMENLIRTDEDGKKHEVLAIIFNPTDYGVGADRGGAVTLFDDFDIDYNKYTYLIETRCSGALRKVASAIVLEMDVTSDDTTSKGDDDLDDAAG